MLFLLVLALLFLNLIKMLQCVLRFHSIVVAHNTKQRTAALFRTIMNNVNSNSSNKNNGNKASNPLVAREQRLLNGSTAIANSISGSSSNRTSSTTTTETSAANMQTINKFEDLVFYPQGSSSSNTEANRYHNITNPHELKRIDSEYEEAVLALNTLQSNELTLRYSINTKKKNACIDTVKYLERSGLTLDEIEQNLSVIHVSGTKGKGSTCALTESILRAHGARTGFFSSPHVVSITERIRINGTPISKEDFTRTFWKVFDVLKSKSENKEDMPAYFMFMTVLSFHVFIEKCVDVAVLEVGIGGEIDCTNVVRNTKTIGICSLGLEHTELLGNTLQEIASQKAGIIKPGSHVYTLAKQPECIEVIEKRAKENNATLIQVQPFKDYFIGTKYEEELQNFNVFLHLNGSLAIQLASDWLRRRQDAMHRDYAVNDTKMNEELLRGLKLCHWPARCQRVDYQNMRIFLDGAHTNESICVCADWFEKSTAGSKNPKILIFNRTGTSDASYLLEVLGRGFQFERVYFTPNVCSIRSGNSKDQMLVRSSGKEQMERAELHMRNWCKVCADIQVPANAQLYPALSEVFDDINKHWPPASLLDEQQQIDVLITGSIHLIGSAICALNEFQMPAEMINSSEKGGDSDGTQSTDINANDTGGDIKSASKVTSTTGMHNVNGSTTSSSSSPASMLKVSLTAKSIKL